MTTKELKKICISQLADYENDLIGEQATAADVVNWQLTPHRTQLENATMDTAELAALLQVNTRSIERYRDKGMPSFWKENPERDDREQWFYCPQGVLFWCIAAHEAGEIELPPAIAALLKDWPAYIATMKSLGATVNTDGTLATYESSGLHWSYITAMTTGESPWTIDPNLQTRAEVIHRRKMFENWKP